MEIFEKKNHLERTTSYSNTLVKGRRGLHEEYAEIKARAPSGTFNHARSLENAAKNRYTDVLCYDHSRVILNPENNESGSDYINANYVDGYKQR